MRDIVGLPPAIFDDESAGIDNESELTDVDGSLDMAGPAAMNYEESWTYIFQHVTQRLLLAPGEDPLLLKWQEQIKASRAQFEGVGSDAGPGSRPQMEVNIGLKLQLASSVGDLSTVRRLWREGSQSSAQSDWYGRALTEASRGGYDNVVKLLLEDCGENVASMNMQDGNGRTPLSWAAEKGHEAIVKLLLSTGNIDVDSRDAKYGQTPLSWAAENGHEAIVKLLLNTGKVDIDSRDGDGRTPLSWAAKKGHKAIVELLLNIGRVD
ncbi:hypothetical protein QQZ08_012456 [Neonectria magnoliae]|uniref:Uncharacterized protein n=1 Tax=Neonectria magnoliae TaxID=2732573 RepID=A0ABR1H1Q7_9HYPO